MGHSAAGVAVTGIEFIFTMCILGFGMAILWIISLIDVIKNEYEGSNTKIMWLVILLLIAPLGTILYQFIGKKQKLNFNTRSNGKATQETKAKITRSSNEPILKSTHTEKCLQCGNVLKERTVMSGEKAGQKFLVCTSYPSCKFIKPIA